MWSNCCNSESPGKRACRRAISAALESYEHHNGVKVFNISTKSFEYLLIKKSKDNILRLSIICYLLGHKFNNVDSLDCGALLNSLYKNMNLLLYFIPYIIYIMHQVFSTRQSTWHHDSRLKKENRLTKDASNRPHINTSWVVCCAKQNFRSSIPKCHNLHKYRI
jgi:hypothetical protein